MVSLGRFIGISKDGLKVFKHVVREEGNNVYNTTRTFYSKVNKDGNIAKTFERNVITKSDIKKSGTPPRSTWTTKDFLDTHYSHETIYYPRAIRKISYDGNNMQTLEQHLFLSLDGKNVTQYVRETPNHIESIVFAEKGGQYHSTNPSFNTNGAEECPWSSLANYNAQQSYYKFK